MKQARDYRKYNVRLMSADWQRGFGRVINFHIKLLYAACSVFLKSVYVVGDMSC